MFFQVKMSKRKLIKNFSKIYDNFDGLYMNSKASRSLKKNFKRFLKFKKIEQNYCRFISRVFLKFFPVKMSKISVIFVRNDIKAIFVIKYSQKWLLETVKISIMAVCSRNMASLTKFQIIFALLVLIF